MRLAVDGRPSGGHERPAELLGPIFVPASIVVPRATGTDRNVPFYTHAQLF
jgi:hypothetical protein